MKIQLKFIIKINQDKQNNPKEYIIKKIMIKKIKNQHFSLNKIKMKNLIQSQNINKNK